MFLLFKFRVIFYMLRNDVCKNNLPAHTSTCTCFYILVQDSLLICNKAFNFIIYYVLFNSKNFGHCVFTKLKIAL